MSKPGSLRETMPTVAGWIDELRAAFGPHGVNEAIRAGIDGQVTFYACENGVEIGTKDKRRGLTVDRISLVSDQRAIEEQVKKGQSNGGRR